jgi:transcriptional regulator with XRE-family HTH domain
MISERTDLKMFSTLEIIKKLAKSRGLTMSKLEENLGYSTNYFYTLKNKKPNSERLQQVADYFNVSTDYLLGRTDNPRVASGKFYFEGKEVDVEELASTAMRFNGMPLNDKDKVAIQNIIEAFLNSQEK